MVMLIKAAENSPHRDDLHDWLKSLEEAVYEAEDVLDEHDYYLLEQKVKSSAGGIKVRFESLPLIKDLSKKFSVAPQIIELKKSLAKLEKIAAKAKDILLFLSAGSSNVTRSQTTNESGRGVTTSRLEHKVFGRDKQRNDIVELLHETAGLVESESSSVDIVAIVGLGGAGKTTLAQYVRQKEAEAKYFEAIMWVHVPQIFDVQKLTREMVESASGVECPNLTNLDALQRKLEDSIRSKKFLLILDDVWNKKEVAEMQWEQLLVPLKAGKKGSKILMTTREKGVAKTLRARNVLYLAELEKEDFLSLFTYYAFAFGDDIIVDDKLYKELKEIVEENAPKLHGSPLAAKMVGSQLRRRPDVDFWKETFSRDLLKDTMESLLWSYQNLNAPLQRCFSFCSLFLKGDNIEREKLIHMWIAEGFIKSTDDSNRIEDVGQNYFDDLLFSSFFQPTRWNGHYTMHDLLHDLAETVSKDRCLRIEGNLTKTIPQEIRHLSLHNINKHTRSDLVEKICNLKNLRTLIIFMRTDDVRIDNLLHSIFVKLKKLRVVHLQTRKVLSLPESIGDLKHLRYLYFNGVVLPKSSYTLYHLEFLHIFIGRLVAKELANWINLRHLHFLTMIINVAEINCWEQLWNKRKFHGYSIEINGLENAKEKWEATMDMDIKKLRLEWSTTDNNSRSLDMDVQVLEGFRLTSKLDDLTIVGYRGCKFPSWMVGDPYPLPNLKSLKLNRCRQLKQLPILPPTLTELRFDDCPSLPTVSKKDLANIKSDERISQVVTFMEGFDATYGGSDIALELPWDQRRGYDSQKVCNWLENTMAIVYQIPQEEEEAQLVLPSSLEILNIESCPSTDSTLREGLRGLTFLESLEINNIVSLTSLPSADVLRCLTKLVLLVIKQCWFLDSLGGLQDLGSLWNLEISFCPNLSAEGGKTPVLPSSLRRLKIEACHWKHLEDSQSDPTSSSYSESSGNIPFTASLQLGNLKLLTELMIINCPNIGSLLGLQELNKLESLTLMGCPILTHEETKLASLKNEFKTDAPLLLSILLEKEVLPELYIEKFKNESFSSEEERVFQHLISLKTLRFENCSTKSLPNNLETLSTLTSLDIDECPNIKSLPDLPRSLKTLSFKNCSIKSLPNNLETLSTLTSLDIDECPNIKSLPDLPRSLETLSFKNCSIKSLPNNLETLSTLTWLEIDECPNIKSLPDLPRSLETLSFKNCSIKFLPNNLETLSTLITLEINKCPNIKSLPDMPRSLIRINLTDCHEVLKRRCQKPHGKDWPKIERIRNVSISLPEYGGCFPWLVEIWGCMEWLSSLFH